MWVTRVGATQAVTQTVQQIEIDIEPLALEDAVVAVIQGGHSWGAGWQEEEKN